MRRFIVIALPIVTLAIFILIMNSTNYLKQPLGKDDHITQMIEEVRANVMEERWDEVLKGTDDLEVAWKKVISRVQFSSERQEINSFTINLARLRGATMAQDRETALVELREAYAHWLQLGE